MTNRMLSTLAWLFVLLVGLNPLGAAAAPKHEIAFGAGLGRSFEDGVLNIPDDFSSSPGAAVSLGYYRNLDDRNALGVHLYGWAEESPILLVTDQAGTHFTTFGLVTYNLGLRYRRTLARGRTTPYVYGGLGWAFGWSESDPTGKFSYDGFSGCAGAGVAHALGRHFDVVLEGMGSIGTAQWKTQPFVNSTGTDFDPSMVAGTLGFRYVWGETR